MKPHWPAPAGLHTASARLPVEGEPPSVSGATGWLNSPPLTAADLRGKVVLVELLDLYLHQLAPPASVCPGVGREYSGAGLVVIGVHTPEFGFEHDVDNVHRAVNNMRVGPGRAAQDAEPP